MKDDKKQKWTSDLREIEKRMFDKGLLKTKTIWPEDLKKIRKQ